jgi:hypothetical protein
MPWFKIDDSAYSHPKFVRAGNAALGLWLRCGAYSAQHLLEGHVPGFIAKAFGTDPQARKLVVVGLWHDFGHTCPRCPDAAADGDYYMHDFFENGRNATRAQVEAARQHATDRQAKSRAAAAGAPPKQKAPSNRPANGVRNEGQSGFETNNIHHAIGGQFSDSSAGQDDLSQRDAIEGVTPSHAAPRLTAVLPDGSTAASTLQISPYDTLGDLKRAIAEAGLSGFAWTLQASQIERARQARDYVGIGPMVTYAVNSAIRLGMPNSASAWIDGWASLEPVPEGTKPPKRNSGTNTTAPTAPRELDPEEQADALQF